MKRGRGKPPKEPYGRIDASMSLRSIGMLDRLCLRLGMKRTKVLEDAVFEMAKRHGLAVPEIQPSDKAAL